MSTQVESAVPMRTRAQFFTALHLSCILILDADFSISSIQKVFRPTAFESVLKAYHLNSSIVRLAVPTIPWLEFSLTLTLLFGIVMYHKPVFSEQKFNRLLEIFEEHLKEKGDKLTDELDTPHFLRMPEAV